MRNLMRVLVVLGIISTALYAAQAPKAQDEAAGLFNVRAVDASFESGSPDGTLVVYRKGEMSGTVYVRDLVSGAERVLAEFDGAVGNFAWSRDSRRLALTFTKKGQKTGDIHVLTIATGENRTLPVSGLVKAWTIKDDILFSVERPIWAGGDIWSLVPAAGGEPRTIYTALGGRLVKDITPDGSSLILEAGGRLVLRDVATGVERSVTAVAATESAPIISNDGRLIAFASDRDGSWGIYVGQLDRLPIRSPLRIASLEHEPEELGGWWTTNGVLAIPRVWYNGPSLYRQEVDVSTGRPHGPLQHLIGDDDYYYTSVIVSPDSHHVTYEAKGGIVVVDAHGGNRRVFSIASRPGQFAEPFAWPSPEEILLFSYAPRNAAPAESSQITALNTTTGTQAPLDEIRGGGPWDFTFVPSRREILYSSGIAKPVRDVASGAEPEAAVIKARSLADGTERIVATIDYLRWFSPSPDGKHIAYGLGKAGLPNYKVAELRLMTIDGQPERTLLMTPKGAYGSPKPVWSPDGKFLLYCGEDEPYDPQVMSVDSGKSWPLLDAADASRFWYFDMS